MNSQDQPSVVIVGHDHLPGFLFLGFGLIVGWLIGSNTKGKPATTSQLGRLGSLINRNNSLVAENTNVGTIIGLGELDDFYKMVKAAIEAALGKIAAGGGANPSSPLYPIYTYLQTLMLQLDAFVQGQANDRLKPVISQLTALGSALTTEAKNLPDATNDVNQLNGFLGAVNSIVNLLK